MKKIIIFITIICIGAAFLLCLIYVNPQERRRRMEIDFLQIGKKLSLKIITDKFIPQSIYHLRQNGALLEHEMEFFTKHGVVYIPPNSITNLEQTILIMPEDAGQKKCIINLGGSMSWEQLTNR